MAHNKESQIRDGRNAQQRAAGPLRVPGVTRAIRFVFVSIWTVVTLTWGLGGLAGGAAFESTAAGHRVWQLGPEAVRPVDVSDDGRLVLTSDEDSAALVVDRDAGRQYRPRLPADPIGDVDAVVPLAMSSDGTSVLIAGNAIYQWDLVSGEQIPVSVTPTGQRVAARYLGSSADGGLVAFVPFQPGPDTLLVRDVVAGTSVPLFPAGAEPLAPLDYAATAFSGDGAHFAFAHTGLGSAGRAGQVLNRLTGTSVPFAQRTIDAGYRVHAVQVSDDGTKVAFQTSDGELFVEDVATGRREQLSHSPTAISGPTREEWSLSDDGIGLARVVAPALDPSDQRGTGLGIAQPFVGTDVHASRGPGGVRLIGGREYRSVLSDNGHWVAVETTATNVGSAVHEVSRFLPPGPHGVLLIELVPTEIDLQAVDLELAPGGGYYTVFSSGLVQSRGGAPLFPSTGPTTPVMRPGETVVSMSVSPSGAGYWLFTTAGRALAFGDAGHHGDVADVLAPGAGLAGQIVASVGMPDGAGYYMIGSDGGIFAFGSARFFGSIPGVLAPGVQLAAPVVSMAPTSDGKGYWLVAADGGMFAFGSAGFFGSIPGILPPGQQLEGPIIGMVPAGSGYLMVATDGGIFNFGQSQFHGSLGGTAIPDRIVAVAVLPDRTGYAMVATDGTIYPFGSATELFS